MAEEEGIERGFPSNGCQQGTSQKAKDRRKRKQAASEDLRRAEGQFTEGDLEGATEELGARGFTAKALVDFVNEAWKEPPTIREYFGS